MMLKAAQTRYTFENFNAGSKSLQWAFVDGCYPKGYAVFSPTGNDFFKIIFNVDENAAISYPDGAFAAATFAIKVPNGGDYTPSIILGGGSSLTQVDAYLMTQVEFEEISGDTYKDKVKKLPASKLLVTVDCYDASVQSKLTPVEYEKANRRLKYNISAASLTSTALADYNEETGENQKNFNNKHPVRVTDGRAVMYRTSLLKAPLSAFGRWGSCRFSD